MRPREKQPTAFRFTKWLFWLLIVPSIFATGELLFQETYKTYKEGSQAIFFTFFHSGHLFFWPNIGITNLLVFLGIFAGYLLVGWLILALVVIFQVNGNYRTRIIRYCIAASLCLIGFFTPYKVFEKWFAKPASSINTTDGTQSSSPAEPQVK